MMLPKKFLIKLNPFSKWASEPCTISSLLFGLYWIYKRRIWVWASRAPFFIDFFFKGYHHIIHIYIIKFVHYLHNTKTSQRKTIVKSKRDGTNQNRSIVSKVRADFHLGNNQAYKPVHKKGTHHFCLEQ